MLFQFVEVFLISSHKRHPIHIECSSAPDDLTIRNSMNYIIEMLQFARFV